MIRLPDQRVAKPSSKRRNKASAGSDDFRSGAFSMQTTTEEEITKMSDRYGYDVPISTKGVAIKSAINAKIPNAHPCNCKHECPYGKDRAFCFPCMKKIMAAQMMSQIELSIQQL